MSAIPELNELHQLIGDLRRCTAALAAKYGDSAVTRRIVNDAERMLNDVERLDIDTQELEFSRGISSPRAASKIGIPDSDYDREFWRDVDDGGVSG